MINNKAKIAIHQVFLTRKSNSTRQLFLLEKCTFSIFIRKMEGDYKLNLHTMYKFFKSQDQLEN